MKVTVLKQNIFEVLLLTFGVLYLQVLCRFILHTTVCDDREDEKERRSGKEKVNKEQLKAVTSQMNRSFQRYPERCRRLPPCSWSLVPHRVKLPPALVQRDAAQDRRLTFLSQFHC